ncbi:MAG: GIY-YIG nuclease family protein [Desulfurococcales archaeon]|nr:GIY-YIG nuclease family protein [Desulfurococcales archaeon]
MAVGVRLNPPPPRGPGLYVLLILLEEPVEVGARTFRGTVPPGLYAYVGSAGGPGGLRARIARHLRRRKRVWWHVDWLTTSPASRVVAVAYCASGTHGPHAEAQVASCLASRGYLPVRGFGSTDDPEAESHLYKTPPGRGAAEAARDALRCLSSTVGGRCSQLSLAR